MTSPSGSIGEWRGNTTHLIVFVERCEAGAIGHCEAKGGDPARQFCIAVAHSKARIHENSMPFVLGTKGRVICSDIDIYGGIRWN